MAAYFNWIKSTQVKYKDPRSCLEIFIKDIDFIVTPGPELWIMKGRGNKFKAYNDDYGLVIDDNEFEDFDVSDWESYMSSALSDPDWHSRVRRGTELTISFGELANMVQLSIDHKIMPAPLIFNELDRSYGKIAIGGDTDGSICPYSFKIGDLLGLVDEGDKYCVVSVGTPSNDGGACYLKVYVASGNVLLKSYEFEFADIGFSSKNIQSIFAKVKTPEFYLAEYNEHGSIPTLDEIQVMVAGW